MGRFEDLQAEVQGDPLSRGYIGMTDQQVLDDMNTVYRDNWVRLSGAEIFEALDLGEFASLTNANTARVDRILSLSVADADGGIATAPGSQARAEMIAVFGAGSNTITNLATIANQQLSRAEEIGLAGYITVTRIGAAR